MPIFEYKCSNCGKISEFLVSGGGNKKLNCPDCGSSKLEKQLSVFSAQVKEGQSKKCHGCTDFKCPHSQK
jgi:putative FmdB family regulatory protein